MSKLLTTNVIQDYALISEDDIEIFYKDLDDILDCVKVSDNTLVLGGLNVKVGNGRCFNIVGDYGFCNRNERGDGLLQFYQENNSIISNTHFKLPPRRLYTWKSNAETENNIIRNQIDFIEIKLASNQLKFIQGLVLGLNTIL